MSQWQVSVTFALDVGELTSEQQAQLGESCQSALFDPSAGTLTLTLGETADTADAATRAAEGQSGYALTQCGLSGRATSAVCVLVVPVSGQGAISASEPSVSGTS